VGASKIHFDFVIKKTTKHKTKTNKKINKNIKKQKNLSVSNKESI